MRKILDFAETATLTILCFALIGIMILEHYIYNAVEIFESRGE